MLVVTIKQGTELRILVGFKLIVGKKKHVVPEIPSIHRAPQKVFLSFNASSSPLPGHSLNPVHT